MADQQYLKEDNGFWIDLHKCSIMEAVGILNSRIDECFKYGISYLEVIYGTPDRYQGSIQQAVDEIKKENALIDHADDIHAGVRIKIKDNPHPEPQDENMHFSNFEANYARRSGEYEYDYYPLRSFYTAHQVSNELNCPVEYVRNVAKTLGKDEVELKTIYNRSTGRNETTWYIYKSGSESIARKWNGDKQSACQELNMLGATDSDIEAILKSFHTPLKANQKIKSRVSSMLTRLKKRKMKKQL
jgi:hypothetical protein